MPAQAGIQTPSSTWITFSNGMTDAVRHLDSGPRRNDEMNKRAYSRN